MDLVSSSSDTPNAGVTSERAPMKSCCVMTRSAASLEIPAMVPAFVCLLKANDAALLHRPLISAPEKFLVRPASSTKSTSAASLPFSFIFLVWIDRICCRPFSSGRLISTCTSRRPGRRSASSIMSFLFVMPMSRILFSWSTPSSLLSSWFTTLSPTPVPPPAPEPRCLQTASSSSKMMTWSSLSSPFSLYSFSASANSFLMFSSDWPTNLFKTSGPLMTLGSLACSIFPIWRAIKVLPVPGGP